jgi:hypothetical protein
MSRFKTGAAALVPALASGAHARSLFVNSSKGSEATQGARDIVQVA